MKKLNKVSVCERERRNGLWDREGDIIFLPVFLWRSWCDSEQCSAGAGKPEYLRRAQLRLWTKV